MLVWCGRSIRLASITWPSSAPDPPGSPPQSMRRRQDSPPCARLPRLWRSGRRLGSIENYLGFPTGITGIALMARAYNQAQKFGVEMAIPDEVSALQGKPTGQATSS